MTARSMIWCYAKWRYDRFGIAESVAAAGARTTRCTFFSAHWDFSFFEFLRRCKRDGCPSPAVSDERVKENVDDKKPRKKKAAAENAK